MDTFWIVPLLHAASDILSAIHQRFKTAVWKEESKKTTVPAQHTDIDNKLTAATNTGIPLHFCTLVFCAVSNPKHCYEFQSAVLMNVQTQTTQAYKG